MWAVMQSLGEGATYPDMLWRICGAIAAALPCDRSTIYTVSRRDGLFVPRADFGTPTEVAERLVRFAFSTDTYPGGQTLTEGRMYVASIDDATGEAAQILAVTEQQTMAVVPMRFHGWLEFVVACGLHAECRFGAERLATLQALSAPLAILIRNARAGAVAARLAERRTWLAKWAAQVLAAHDVLGIADLLAATSRDLFRATGASLMLLEGHELISRSRSASDPRGEVVLRQPLSTKSAAVDALDAGRVLVVNDYAKSPYAQTNSAASPIQPASTMIVPLGDGLGPVGVLMVNDLRHPVRFGDTDEEDGLILGAIATAAIRKVHGVEELTRASAAKSEFLANVSHDLRTPLNIIVGYTQLLAEQSFGITTPEQDDSLARVLRTARNQLSLIDDLLDLARIEQGRLRCEPQAMSIAAVVPGLTEMMEVLLGRRAVSFDVEIAPDAIAAADPERVRQILVNLLANAAKFTESGSVRLKASREHDQVRLVIEDTGPGIDPNLGERLLEPFAHGSGPGAGSGLGLAIVSRLVRIMGGKLAIDSVPGRGTRVEVRLPAAKPAEAFDSLGPRRLPA